MKKLGLSEQLNSTHSANAMELQGGGGEPAAHVVVTLGAPWRLAPLPALPPGHQVIRASSCTLSLFLVTSLFLAPAAVLAAVELSHAYLLLFLGQVVIAVGALEWSWLAFRIRKKLLFTLSVRDDVHDPQRGLNDGDSIPEQAQNNDQELEQEQDDTRLVAKLVMQRRREMRPAHCAVTAFADRHCCGQWALVALVVALIGSGVALAAAFLLDRDVFYRSSERGGPRMLVAMTVGGMSLSFFLGCLAPSKVDTLVLAMYMGCFIASSLNTFLMYYANAIGSSDLIDPLFVLLVGSCAIFLLRVVSSKLVMTSLFCVMTDILGLIFVVGPMQLAADFVSHPGAARHRAKLALFFLVIFASEVGRWLTQVLRTRRASPLQALRRLCCCRRRPSDEILAVDQALKNTAISSSHVEELIGAIVLGAFMLPVSLAWGHRDAIGVTETVMLLAAMGLGQWSRFLIASVKQMAEVTTTGFYLPTDSSLGGVLDRMAVLLVAVIVFHPYAKHVIYT